MRAADLMLAAVWLSVASAVSLWLAYGGLNQVTDPASAITAVGIVTGLVGTDLILVMLVLAARIPAIDRVVGQDKTMAFHRRLGKPALYLILAHAVLLTVGYAMSDGPGFDPAIAATVFERFSSSRAGTRPGAPGDGTRHYGLGLAIVAEIARRHDGTVSIDQSHPGGAVVCSFPLALRER